MKSLYLINPASSFPHYFGTDAYSSWGLQPKAYCIDQAVTTLAAMAPQEMRVRLCEEAVEPADLEATEDFVGITGKISQWSRMKFLAESFRRRKKIVIIGGPLASLSPEMVRPYCDILVRGELEDVYQEFFQDLLIGKWKTEYQGPVANLENTILPRYDLYPNNRTLYGSIQTSRGCPYKCDFCDVIQYLGPRQRHKPISRILEELDSLRSFGYSSVFITDDNFATQRSYAKEKLAAIKVWNDRVCGGRMSFFSQTAVDVAEDDEMLDMMFNAGLECVFLGIETPNKASLSGSNKKQNVGVDFHRCIQRFLDQGIQVGGGIMIGFDSDGPDIFRQVNDFIGSLPVPFFSIGCLVAPRTTPLYHRLQGEGRLIEASGAEIAAVPWQTNFFPKQMTLDQLYAGMKWLCSNVYHPRAYEKRILDFLKTFSFRQRGVNNVSGADSFFVPERSGLFEDGMKLVGKLAALGSEEAGMVERLQRVASTNPDKAIFLFAFMVMYAQIRHMYSHQGFYEEKLAEL